MWLKVGAIVGVALLVWAHWAQDKDREEALDKARDTIAQQRKDIQSFEETNEHNLAEIAKLETANQDWAEQWAAHTGDWDAERLRLRNELISERNARRLEREAANAELERILESNDWNSQPLPADVAEWVCKHLTGGCEG